MNITIIRRGQCPRHTNRMKRLRYTIQGIVQGVGFRPYVYRIAKALSLSGRVKNSAKGVIVEVEGERVDEFLEALLLHLPPLAKVSQWEVEELNPLGECDFVIEESEQSEGFTLVSPDIATCEDCLAELFDSRDRRYLYPFINCTNCGPRFTIIERIPYDRVNTTMKEFVMCEDCLREYEDPENRRFHAQPNACPVCGPYVELDEAKGEDAIRKAVDMLSDGKIVAIKGLGGYHLACDALNNEAVERLRGTKRKNNKPFALMGTMEMIEEHTIVSPAERKLLLSTSAPIVLLEKREDSGISPAVAPGLKWLGFMLPYTPLHHILIHHFNKPIVLTSANRSDEPIVYEDDSPILNEMADATLTHNRKIYIRCDDSVCTIFNDKLYAVRRSRGFAPRPIPLPLTSHKDILAVGGMMKNTFTVVKDGYAFMSQHIGDVETLEALSTERSAIKHFLEIFSVNPEIVVCDKHPLYPTRHLAEEFGLPVLEVQHHRAHIASCLAENGITGRVIGVALDGTGYGDDGKIWGGEFFVGEFFHLNRVGHLRYIGLPGGDKGIREPWRFALSVLYALGMEGRQRWGCLLYTSPSPRD